MASFDFTVLLVAKDMASRTIGNVQKSVGKLGRSAAISRKALVGLSVGLGAAAGAGALLLARNVQSGIESLADLESATTSVDGALRQMGQSGQLTGAQVATWANEIEASVGAAFDDKDIVRATAGLIRYGKVAPKNLRPAMVVMTDLAAKTGSVESASTLLAKALADPAKAAGKLARAGVVLTAEEQKTIASMVKAGKTAKAQDYLLRILAKTTSGAAVNSQGKYRTAMNKLGDAVEDVQRALAEGFLPILEEVASFLSKELAKPATINSIKEFGKSLAGGLKGLIDTARGLDWAKIGAALKTGADAAKGILDAFLGLPDWVKTVLIGGFVANKVTGGAVGDLVSELGKGLIKGVLGMNAAVVNINAGIVKGPGGLPGVGGPGGGGKPGLPPGAVVPAIGAATAGMGVGTGGRPTILGQSVGSERLWVWIQKGINSSKVVPQVGDLKEETRAITNRQTSILEAGDDRTAGRIDMLNRETGRQTSAVRSGNAGIVNKLGGVGTATSAAGAKTAAAMNAAKSTITGAVNGVKGTIAGKDFRPRVTVNVQASTTVSVRTVGKASAVTARYNYGNRIYEREP